MGRTNTRVTEPAHSLMYNPGSLSPGRKVAETNRLYHKVKDYLNNPFNESQESVFHAIFNNRISLVWGPPGTGKTTVLTGSILGWIEYCSEARIPLHIGIGSSNYNAIDNVLNGIQDLIHRRVENVGELACPISLKRVRSDSAAPCSDDQIEDVPSNSPQAQTLVNALNGSDPEIIIVGGTWQQLGRLAEKCNLNNKPAAEWFDLLAIDEASQVKVASAAAYFLLLKPDGHVVLAGDNRQLGPIYTFKMKDNAQGLFECIFSYMNETYGISPIQLKHNYRTNVVIAEWPSNRFYDGNYAAFFPDKRLNIDLGGRKQPKDWPSDLPWSDQFLRILDPDIPVVVVSYSASTYTLSNPFEAQIISALTFFYKKLVDAQQDRVNPQDFWTERIGIVTPHRAQRVSIRNLLIEKAGMTADPPPFVDTVDRFQGLERDLILSSYVVADRDFIASEASFILSPRRFNVTLTRARCKIVMFISDTLLQYLPLDPDIAHDATHLQLFAQEYCGPISETTSLPFFDHSSEYCSLSEMRCRLRGRKAPK